MNEIRLPDSELKVMGFLWDKGYTSAKAVAEYMSETYSWKKNTTYTVLKNLIAKQVVERKEPDFICLPLVTREQVGKTETNSLLERFYKGSVSALISSFLNDRKLSKEELEEIKKMIDESK